MKNRQPIENQFVKSYIDWKELPEDGFYLKGCDLTDEYKHLIPEGTNSICVFFCTSKSVIEFSFYNDTTNIETLKIFDWVTTLGEEIT